MIELLAPAGGLEQLRAALRYGADAVYLGLKDYGLRAGAGNFRRAEFEEALSLAHSMEKKIYATLNIFAYDEDIAGMVESARYLYEAGVDAVIVADPGVVSCLREELPGLCLHLSTQANTLNSASVAFWRKNGISRIVLARELRIEQIAEIHRNHPGFEIECFVHGAVCMAYSGRCLLSNYLAGRDGNQGNCAQSCRWQYHLEEMRRPGEYLPIEQDEKGTYMLSARDLNMIEHLPALMRAGVCGFKIEGRMKQPYYVGTVVRAYRQAIDHYLERPDTALPEEIRRETDMVSHREYDTGFYFGAPAHPGGADGFHQSAQHVGDIIEYMEPEKTLRLRLRNRIHVGDPLEILPASGPVIRFFVDSILVEKSAESVDTWGHPLDIVRLPLGFSVQPGDIVRGPNRNHRREGSV